MVKFPTSSKSPAFPNPRTAPFGPPPETFSHSMGVSGTVLEEHDARRRAAAKPGIGRMLVTWASRGTDRRRALPFASTRLLVASRGWPASPSARRGRHHIHVKRKRGIGGIIECAIFGTVDGGPHMFPVRGDRPIRGEPRSAPSRARCDDCMRGGV